MRAFVGLVASGLALLPQAHAQTLSDLLQGRWIVGGADCTAGVTLQLGTDSLRLTDAAGRVDTQHVTSRRAAGIATRTTESARGDPAGTVWVYEVLAPGQLSVTQGSTGRSATLLRCPDLLPANATPGQMVEAIYARYAASDEANLPLAGEANVRAFFTPRLADEITAFAAHSGRLPDECKPDDPFVPGAFGEYAVTKVHADTLPSPAGTGQATVQVSFSNLGKPAAVSVLLDRTPAGWRIADVSQLRGQSFQASMAACLASPK